MLPREMKLVIRHLKSFRYKNLWVSQRCQKWTFHGLKKSKLTAGTKGTAIGSNQVLSPVQPGCHVRKASSCSPISQTRSERGHRALPEATHGFDNHRDRMGTFGITRHFSSTRWVVFNLYSVHHRLIFTKNHISYFIVHDTWNNRKKQQYKKMFRTNVLFSLVKLSHIFGWIINHIYCLLRWK